MSAAATAAGYLYAAGIMGHRREQRERAQQPKHEPDVKPPRQVKVTYRKRIPTER